MSEVLYPVTWTRAGSRSTLPVVLFPDYDVGKAHDENYSAAAADGPAYSSADPVLAVFAGVADFPVLVLLGVLVIIVRMLGLPFFLGISRWCIDKAVATLLSCARAADAADRATSAAAAAASDGAIPSSSSLVVPQHIAFIMDGNRRHGKAVYGDAGRGHTEGGRALSRIVGWCLDMGVRVVTAYAFSTENWNRDPKEITLLMSIFERQADEILREALARDIRVRVLASQPERLPASVRAKFCTLEERTRGGERLTLNLCVSYGGRDEIVGACRRVARRVEDGVCRADEVDEAMLSREMLTGGTVCPDPDLLVRTSGEQRLSNFLLWQVAYAEMIFVEKHWPAMEREDLAEVVREFSRRKRRFGK